MKDILTMGIDIGSTTIKFAVTDGSNILYECYTRHFSMVREKTKEIFSGLSDLLSGKRIKLAVSGSAGYGLACKLGLPFVQEVFATTTYVTKKYPDVSVAIELGGEDAKVIFFGATPDERMNGTCAGGTGAFIDQMASLLNITADELDKLYFKHTQIYPIASRCGVFAKSDIQPLINQGAKKENLAASVYQAVVNQTISGLIQGSEISGKVIFLGGPLYYCNGLRERFIKTLELSEENAICPEHSRISVALGASIYASDLTEEFTYEELLEIFSESALIQDALDTAKPLFKDEKEYEDFLQRHKSDYVPRCSIEDYDGNIYIGIDCGSTTTKLIAINDKCEILYSYYGSNMANPVEVVKNELINIYNRMNKNAVIKGVSTTGYGEELIKNAFNADFGLVETMAHFYAAEYFNPEVDFILDIGGQDIKCFKIKNKAIDSIMLNEACSSGCGSFIETFAKSLGFEIDEFAKLGLFASSPVNLGSRCTVFMNSSVKQAQKDGATVSDISAGLSMSVVKNAIYKVIRANSADELGKNIVVQGGTFLNDAILRSFELELGIDVIRPEIAGLMGAFGAALYARKKAKNTSSSLLNSDDLINFTHKSTNTKCSGCGNRCNLTINTFSSGKKYISGNKCEKGLGYKEDNELLPNMFEYKREKLFSYKNVVNNGIKIGIPMTLSMYEFYPLWHKIFLSLGFSPVISGMSDREIYMLGQHTIPSDTVCYPAKLMHGHITKLLNEDIKYIFYPSMTYNIDEKTGENNYNCPVVAYYSELLNSNMKQLEKCTFMYPYLNINDEKVLSKSLYEELKKHFSHINYKDVKNAVKSGFKEYKKYKTDIKNTALSYIQYAENNDKKILVFSGRPYHIDNEICHSIDKLASSLGFVILTEDAVSELSSADDISVLNQWTFHSRMYNAAQFVTENKNAELVQLVSFGCGIDAITTDEIRTILENSGKLYTQLKIDEINNSGTVKIRLRSLLAAINEKTF